MHLWHTWLVYHHYYHTLPRSSAHIWCVLKRPPVAPSCAPPLCRPLTGPGVHEGSSYHLIPEFRGARAQWNFTDHLVKLNSFKAPPQLPYISLTHRWPVCGSIEAGEEPYHQGVNRTICYQGHSLSSCRASL